MDFRKGLATFTTVRWKRRGCWPPPEGMGFPQGLGDCGLLAPAPAPAPAPTWRFDCVFCCSGQLMSCSPPLSYSHHYQPSLIPKKAQSYIHLHLKLHVRFSVLAPMDSLPAY